MSGAPPNARSHSEQPLETDRPLDALGRAHAPRRAGLRLQLVVALGALGILAFVPLFLAVASLTRHTLRVTREESARALGRAVAGRLAADVANGHDEATLRDVARVSIVSDPIAPAGAPGDESIAESASSGSGSEGVVAIRITQPPLGAGAGVSGKHIEVGHPGTLEALRMLPPMAPGERTAHAHAAGVGPVVAVEIRASTHAVQVALRVGDQASRAAPLLRLIAFYTAAFAIVLVVAAYLLLGRLIVGPIAALVQATRRVVDADPASTRGTAVRRFEAPAAGAAEVIELGRAIARTTGRLVEREESLAAKVRQLEAARADLLAARDAIVRSERLASVGRLAAGLAHEVGNPIAALMGLEDVVLGGDLDEETRDLVERMKRETERVHRVLRDLLDFARAGQEPRAFEALIPESAAANVREVAHEVLALVKPQPSVRDLTLDVEVEEGLRPVRLSPGRLQQVLLNLVLNAADAIGDHARRTGVEAHGDPIGRVVVRAVRGEGPHVRIEVEDDGPGVPETIRANLFEPFVTTKDVGKGTGLGLAVCRGLIEGVGGTIALEEQHATALGGARFVLVIPTVDAPLPPRSIAPPGMPA